MTIANKMLNNWEWEFIAIWIFIGLLVLTLVIVSVAQAQPGIQHIDFTKANFQWNANASTDNVTAYTIKCGTISGGPYPLTLAVGPSVTQQRMNTVLSKIGIYYCVCTATNITGESLPSNEITFQADYPFGIFIG